MLTALDKWRILPSHSTPSELTRHLSSPSRLPDVAEMVSFSVAAVPAVSGEPLAGADRPSIPCTGGGNALGGGWEDEVSGLQPSTSCCRGATERENCGAEWTACVQALPLQFTETRRAPNAPLHARKASWRPLLGMSHSLTRQVGICSARSGLCSRWWWCIIVQMIQWHSTG